MSDEQKTIGLNIKATSSSTYYHSASDDLANNRKSKSFSLIVDVGQAIGLPEELANEVSLWLDNTDNQSFLKDLEQAPRGPQAFWALNSYLLVLKLLGWSQATTYTYADLDWLGQLSETELNQHSQALWENLKTALASWQSQPGITSPPSPGLDQANRARLLQELQNRLQTLGCSLSNLLHLNDTILPRVNSILIDTFWSDTVALCQADNLGQQTFSSLRDKLDNTLQEIFRQSVPDQRQADQIYAKFKEYARVGRLDLLTADKDQIDLFAAKYYPEASALISNMIRQARAITLDDLSMAIGHEIMPKWPAQLSIVKDNFSSEDYGLYVRFAFLQLIDKVRLGTQTDVPDDLAIRNLTGLTFILEQEEFKDDLIQGLEVMSNLPGSDVVKTRQGFSIAGIGTIDLLVMPLQGKEWKTNTLYQELPPELLRCQHELMALGLLEENSRNPYTGISVTGDNSTLQVHTDISWGYYDRNTYAALGLAYISQYAEQHNGQLPEVVEARFWLDDGSLNTPLIDYIHQQYIKQNGRTVGEIVTGLFAEAKDKAKYIITFLQDNGYDPVKEFTSRLPWQGYYDNQVHLDDSAKVNDQDQKLFADTSLQLFNDWLSGQLTLTTEDDVANLKVRLSQQGLNPDLATQIVDNLILETYRFQFVVFTIALDGDNDVGEYLKGFLTSSDPAYSAAHSLYESWSRNLEGIISHLCQRAPGLTRDKIRQALSDFLKNGLNKGYNIVLTFDEEQQKISGNLTYFDAGEKRRLPLANNVPLLSTLQQILIEMGVLPDDYQPGQLEPSTFHGLAALLGEEAIIKEGSQTTITLTLDVIFNLVEVCRSDRVKRLTFDGYLQEVARCQLRLEQIEQEIKRTKSEPADGLLTEQKQLREDLAGLQAILEGAGSWEDRVTQLLINGTDSYFIVWRDRQRITGQVFFGQTNPVLARLLSDDSRLVLVPAGNEYYLVDRQAHEKAGQLSPQQRPDFLKSCEQVVIEQEGFDLTQAAKAKLLVRQLIVSTNLNLLPTLVTRENITLSYPLHRLKSQTATLLQIIANEPAGSDKVTDQDIAEASRLLTSFDWRQGTLDPDFIRAFLFVFQNKFSSFLKITPLTKAQRSDLEQLRSTMASNPTEVYNSEIYSAFLPNLELANGTDCLAAVQQMRSSPQTPTERALNLLDHISEQVRLRCGTGNQAGPLRLAAFLFQMTGTYTTEITPAILNSIIEYLPFTDEEKQTLAKAALELTSRQAVWPNLDISLNESKAETQAKAILQQKISQFFMPSSVFELGFARAAGRLLSGQSIRQYGAEKELPYASRLVLSFTGLLKERLTTEENKLADLQAQLSQITGADPGQENKITQLSQQAEKCRREIRSINKRLAITPDLTSPSPVTTPVSISQELDLEPISNADIRQQSLAYLDYQIQELCRDRNQMARDAEAMGSLGFREVMSNPFHELSQWANDVISDGIEFYADRIFNTGLTLGPANQLENNASYAGEQIVRLQIMKEIMVAHPEITTLGKLHSWIKAHPGYFMDKFPPARLPGADSWFQPQGDVPSPVFLAAQPGHNQSSYNYGMYRTTFAGWPSTLEADQSAKPDHRRYHENYLELFQNLPILRWALAAEKYGSDIPPQEAAEIAFCRGLDEWSKGHFENTEIFCSLALHFLETNPTAQATMRQRIEDTGIGSARWKIFNRGQLLYWAGLDWNLIPAIEFTGNTLLLLLMAELMAVGIAEAIPQGIAIGASKYPFLKASSTRVINLANLLANSPKTAFTSWAGLKTLFQGTVTAEYIWSLVALLGIKNAANPGVVVPANQKGTSDITDTYVSQVVLPEIEGLEQRLSDFWHYHLLIDLATGKYESAGLASQDEADAFYRQELAAVATLPDKEKAALASTLADYRRNIKTQIGVYQKSRENNAVAVPEQDIQGKLESLRNLDELLANDESGLAYIYWEQQLVEAQQGLYLSDLAYCNFLLNEPDLIKARMQLGQNQAGHWDCRVSVLTADEKQRLQKSIREGFSLKSIDDRHRLGQWLAELADGLFLEGNRYDIGLESMLRGTVQLSGAFALESSYDSPFSDGQGNKTYETITVCAGPALERETAVQQSLANLKAGLESLDLDKHRFTGSGLTAIDHSYLNALISNYDQVAGRVTDGLDFSGLAGVWQTVARLPLIGETFGGGLFGGTWNMPKDGRRILGTKGMIIGMIITTSAGILARLTTSDGTDKPARKWAAVNYQLAQMTPYSQAINRNYGLAFGDRLLGLGDYNKRLAMDKDAALRGSIFGRDLYTALEMSGWFMPKTTPYMWALYAPSFGKMLWGTSDWALDHVSHAATNIFGRYSDTIHSSRSEAGFIANPLKQASTFFGHRQPTTAQLGQKLYGKYTMTNAGSVLKQAFWPSAEYMYMFERLGMYAEAEEMVLAEVAWKPFIISAWSKMMFDMAKSKVRGNQEASLKRELEQRFQHTESLPETAPASTPTNNSGETVAGVEYTVQFGDWIEESKLDPASYHKTLQSKGIHNTQSNYNLTGEPGFFSKHLKGAWSGPMCQFSLLESGLGPALNAGGGSVNPQLWLNPPAQVQVLEKAPPTFEQIMAEHGFQVTYNQTVRQISRQTKLPVSQVTIRTDIRTGVGIASIALASGHLINIHYQIGAAAQVRVQSPSLQISQNLQQSLVLFGQKLATGPWTKISPVNGQLAPWSPDIMYDLTGSQPALIRETILSGKLGIMGSLKLPYQVFLPDRPELICLDRNSLLQDLGSLRNRLASEGHNDLADIAGRIIAEENNYTAYDLQKSSYLLQETARIRQCSQACPLAGRTVDLRSLYDNEFYAGFVQTYNDFRQELAGSLAAVTEPREQAFQIGAVTRRFWGGYVGQYTREEVLAAWLGELIHRRKGFDLNEVQIMASLALGDNAVQLTCGEGKTLVVLMSMMKNVLESKALPQPMSNLIFTSGSEAVDEGLAEAIKIIGDRRLRDLNISVVKITEDNRGLDTADRQKKYSADIIYLKVADGNFDDLFDTQQTKADQIVQPRYFYSAVFDEIDEVFRGQSKIPYIIASASNNSQALTRNQLLVFARLALEIISDNNKNDRAEADPLYQTQVHDEAGDLNISEISLTPSGQDWLIQKLKSEGLPSGIDAQPYEFILTQALTAKLNPPPTARVGNYLYPINSGEASQASTYQDNIQQFIEIFNGLTGRFQISPFTEATLYTTVVDFIQRKVVRPATGCSGTISNLTRIVLYNNLGIQTINVPTHSAKALTSLPNRLCASETAYWQEVLKTVGHFHDRGQPILLGCTLRNIPAVAERLREAGFEVITITAETPPLLQKIYIEKVSRPGTIVVGDIELIGRANNYRSKSDTINRKVDSLGGLVVLALDLETSDVMTQLLLRTARQQYPGVAGMIIRLDDPLLQDYLPFLPGFLSASGLAGQDLIMPINESSRSFLDETGWASAGTAELAVNASSYLSSRGQDITELNHRAEAPLAELLSRVDLQPSDFELWFWDEKHLTQASLGEFLEHIINIAQYKKDVYNYFSEYRSVALNQIMTEHKLAIAHLTGVLRGSDQGRLLDLLSGDLNMAVEQALSDCLASELPLNQWGSRGQISLILGQENASYFINYLVKTHGFDPAKPLPAEQAGQVKQILQSALMSCLRSPETLARINTDQRLAEDLITTVNYAWERYSQRVNMIQRSHQLPLPGTPEEAIYLARVNQAYESMLQNLFLNLRWQLLGPKTFQKALAE